MPWPLRRFVLRKFFGYELHPGARIGMAWVYPAKLIMEENSRIDHFTVAIHLDKLHIGKNSSIGRSNWITGLSVNTKTDFFKHQSDRKAELIIGDESSITKNHHIDCTNSVRIGNFVTLAGYYSQLLTHSIDPVENRQHSEAIELGDYTFIGTNVVILGGAVLPPRSVLGAKSLLNKKFTDEWMLYAGVPAKPVSQIEKSAKYFTREKGYVI